MINSEKSIEELEDNFWPPLKDYKTSLIEQIYDLRKKKIIDLEDSEIRLLISQDIGIRLLIDKGLNLLNNNILIDTFFYPGDLLLTILEIKKEFWEKNPLQKKTLLNILKKNHSILNNLPATLNAEISDSILKEINKFKNK